MVIIGDASEKDVDAARVAPWRYRRSRHLSPPSRLARADEMSFRYPAGSKEQARTSLVERGAQWRVVLRPGAAVGFIIADYRMSIPAGARSLRPAATRSATRRGLE